MKRNEPSVFLCRALISLIGVFMIAFLGFGVRLFATADATQLIFSATFIISVAILVLYFTLRRPTRDPMAHAPFREPPFVKRSSFPRLCTIGGNSIASTGEAGMGYAENYKPLSRAAAGGIGNS